IPQVNKPNFQPAKPTDTPQFSSVPPPDSRQIPTPAPGKITGLIVECTRAPQPVQPAMSPKIYVAGNPSKVVYGAGNLDTATAVQKGAVGYVTSLEAARQAVERVGTNPLVVAAVETDGISSVGISQADADKVAEADRTDGFLKNCAVMFVIKD
ncbi:MAG: hypothetical protein QHJ73_10300, partial [Armatimonadota bacterium]|nr:hypothetical protein [Armatimonadota bacterium]